MAEPHLYFCFSRSNSLSLVPTSVACGLPFLSHPIPNRSQRSPPTFLPPTHPIVLSSNTSRHNLGTHQQAGQRKKSTENFQVSTQPPHCPTLWVGSETKEQYTHQTEQKPDKTTQTCNDPNPRCLDISLKTLSVTAREKSSLQFSNHDTAGTKHSKTPEAEEKELNKACMKIKEALQKKLKKSH